MKKLLLLLSLSAALMACDKLKKAENATDDVSELNRKTELLLKEIQDTNAAIRLQKMSVCQDQMLSDYASDRIFPVPTGLMACAKVFAEASTAAEITDYIFLELKEIDEVNPIKDTDADGMEVDYTPEQQHKLMIGKFRLRQMLYALSGFLPESTVDQIIAEQRYGGARRPTMLNMLMMRALFTQQVSVEDQYLKSGFVTVGQGREAVKEMKKVEKILRLPFRDELFIKTTGIVTPELYDGPIANADVQMNTETLKILTASWSKIASFAETLQTASTEPGGKSQVSEGELVEQREIVKTAKEYAKGWEGL